MAVYYKFKSAKDYDSVLIDGHFISVGHLKEKIFELKHLGRGTDFDLLVTNAQTNEEYLDEGMLIPKNTSVLIRRVPGCPCKPIITAPVTEQQESIVKNNSDDVQAVKGSFSGADPSATKYAEDLEWDEFGNDLYAMPETTPVQLSIPVQDALAVSKEDEDSKIKALIDTPALDWQRQPSGGFGSDRGFGCGMGGRMTGGRGFGRGGFDRSGFEKKTPPPGYTCHRCKVPGHFIQHCPTNGDPSFDIKRMKPPTGIPKSMLIATPDGSYSLPSGAGAVMRPNEAAFEKEFEGMPSTRTVGDLPPELHCPAQSAVSKGQQVPAPPPEGEETSKIAETVEENKPPMVPVEMEKISSRLPDVSEATHDLRTLKQAASQGSALLADEEEQQKPISGEAGKKKKKKKIRMSPGATDMQWISAQEFAPENYMMHTGPSNFDPYWNGMQPGFDGFMPPYGGPMPPYMGYGLNPMDLAFGGVLPHGPFGGLPCMFPPYGPGPQRDLSELAMGFNPGPPPPMMMSREELEARKASDLKRKREMERRGERELPRDSREYGREGSNRVNVSSMKLKSNSSIPPPSSGGQPLRHRSPDPPRPSSKRRTQDYDDHHHRPSSKRRTEDYDHDFDHHQYRPSSKRRTEDNDDHHQYRPSSKKSYDYDPADDYHHHRPSSNKSSDYESPSQLMKTMRRRKMSSEAPPPAVDEEHMARRSVAAMDDNESSDEDDDERHFKRRPSRYNSSPPPPEVDQPPRHSRWSRDRDRAKHHR